MQITTTTPRHDDRFIAVLTGAGVTAAIVLFFIVIGRFGLFGELGSANGAAPAADIVVDARQMRFGQDEIHLTVGQTVAIALDNHDLYAHSFDIDVFGVHVAMPQKQEVFATFTATRPGVFTFYCGLPGHKEAGMVGTIIVEP